MKTIGGDIPQINRNAPGYGIKPLYFSEREVALIKDKTVSPGYGVLQAGTVMSVNTSAAGGKGEIVPYVPVYGSLTLGTISALGASALVADAVSGTVTVSLVDSYKYRVGDDLVIENSLGTGPIACGAITAITRTDPRYATITTSAFTATNLTVANSAYVYVEAGASDPWSTAKYILDKAVDTGVGENANGALTSVLISNAMVYTSNLVNMTAEAITALGAVADGVHTIIK